jgi:hypothetical protein
MADYVSLATESSKLGGMSVICYEIWQEVSNGHLSQTKLAIATKNHIFLYGTPKGERAFKFIKVAPLSPQRWDINSMTGFLYSVCSATIKICPSATRQSQCNPTGVWPSARIISPNISGFF